jgi:tetratricopeptide (TPR) repeat protein
MVGSERGEGEEARRLFRESLALDHEMGYPRGIAVSLHNLAALARRRGDYDEAQRLSEESYALCEKLGYQEGMIYNLTSLGQIAAGRGEPERAAVYFREGFAVALRLRAVPWALEILVARAKSLVGGGDGEGAVELLATAVSHPASEKENKKRAEWLLAVLRAELPPEAFAAAFARGKAKRWEEWGES